MTIEIRELRPEDLPEILATNGGAAWNGGAEKWNSRLAEHQSGRRVVMLAIEDSNILGYGSLLWSSAHRGFRDSGTPEIQDLVVAETRRGQGIGRRLIRALEDRARASGCARVGIGFGLYADYGPAQHLYVSLGYVPDGSGMAYAHAPVVPGSMVKVDDDLVLWLAKPLGQSA